MNCEEQLLDAAQEVMKTLNKIPADFSEGDYENALMYELRLREIPYDQQRNIDIFYKGHRIACRTPDLILYPSWCDSDQDEYLVDAKKVAKINKNHRKQVQVYLLSMDIKKGSLLNFNNKTGEPELHPVEKPDRMLKTELAKPRKTNQSLDKTLKQAGKDVLDFLGTDFFYYDAGTYVKALGVELRLKRIDFSSVEHPILYKGHMITNYTYDYVFRDGSAAKVFTYKDPEEIKEKTKELKKTNKMFDVKKGYILAIPEKDKEKVVVKEV